MRTFIGIAFLLVMLFSIDAAKGRTFIVDRYHPEASDRNPGTSDKPYRTIGRALRAPLPGDVILILSGVYEEGPIVLTRSGTAEKPITIMAETPGSVVITGGDAPLRYTTQNEPFQIGPQGRDPNNRERFAGAQHITLRGLVFQNSPGSGIAAATGWTIQDCLIDRANYDGIVARGDDILIERTVVQNCGVNGMAGGYGSNIRVINSIIRRCNQFPDSPGGNAGASKFLGTRGMVVDGLISYDNFGSGWWFDWDNDNYTIRNSTIFGVHSGTAWENGKYVEHPWAATGIWTEGNFGPGLIENNMIWSCVAAGIGILDSREVTVRNNIVADCGAAMEFRDMNRDSAPELGRKRNIYNIVVEGNQFMQWRDKFAIVTSIGEFRRGDKPGDYRVTFRNNRFEPGKTNGLFHWIQTDVSSPDEAQRKLSIDAATNQLGTVDFRRPLFATYSTGKELLDSVARDRFTQVDAKKAEAVSFAALLQNAKVGDEVTLPVLGRTEIITGEKGAMTTTVYDLQGRHVTIRIANDAVRQVIETQLPRHALLDPITLKVRLTSIDPYDVQGDPIN